jgi:hypothetical protein
MDVQPSFHVEMLVRAKGLLCGSQTAFMSGRMTQFEAQAVRDIAWGFYGAHHIEG